ncbi:MAG: ABC transporter permease subunit [Alphaproteobacteria bacterium]|nr:ABC transporter permease subunit [Alphaproteobacteria bacterium]
MFVCQALFSPPDAATLAARKLTLADGNYVDANGKRARCLGGYVGKLLGGDFGPSYKYKDFTVAELIADGAPVSALLGISAILLATFVGMTLGTFSALRQNSIGDYSVMTLAMVGVTIPSFVMAPILTLIFGVYLGWLPVGGWAEGQLRNMVLPVISLSLLQIAVIARLTRGGMIEVLRSNYVRTARAKGLPERLVITRHAMRAALLPLVSYLGPATAGIVTGSLVVEQIFQLPGIGKYFINGALQRDYTLVMGVVILYATLVIMLNLVADVLYGILDPKVKYD